MVTATKTKVCPKCGEERKAQGFNLHHKYCKGREGTPDMPLTKQEELQRALSDIIGSYEKARVLLRFLDAQGAVLKVDGKMPQFQSRLTDEANWELLKKDGWTKTERLIEEG